MLSYIFQRIMKKFFEHILNFFIYVSLNNNPSFLIFVHNCSFTWTAKNVFNKILLEGGGMSI